MKKGIILSILMVAGLMAFAQQATPQWNHVLSDIPESYRIQLISSSEQSIQVNVQVPGFYTISVTTPRGEAQVVTMPKAVSTAQAGEPDVPMTGIPVLIGDRARMAIRVVDAQYRDFEGIAVAPSKGDFPRTINPDDVPYTYGACYGEDAFFPASNIGLYEPYIIRDFRGQNMVVYPFAYNPATQTLRVYYNMTVEMYKLDDNGENVMPTRRSNVVKMDPDFKSVYQRHFVNYEAAMNRYTPVDEEGDLLIICYDNFMSSMTDFVNWKKTRGVNTTIVGTSTAGSSASAIKSYIQSQYNANNNLTHVLLVGDVAQIPGNSFSYGSGNSGYSGKGDNAYGQIVGSDLYNDVFIGRFSATTTDAVTTQASRVITYERDLTTSASWLQKGEGIARKEGASADQGEDDYQHMNNIRTDLLNYGYSTVYQRYANLTGYDGSSATISSDINSGVGIVNYCNHGFETGWGANSSGYIYYTNSHVNALTNDNKLPFIWSVACLCGQYDYSSDCFAEAWMKATNNSTGQPTGAIGTLMSYISQPWNPPMYGQDECVDILVESYSSNIKHSWAGVSINGLFYMLDQYGSQNQGKGTYQAWILFGDPTLMLRTKTPQAMTVNHAGTIAPGATSYSVTVSNSNGAVATITDASHNILGKATVNNGTANITVTGTLTAGTELTLCVFGYNKVTYLGTINVVNSNQFSITATANPDEGGTVSGAGSYDPNSSCTLTAMPNTGYTFTNWTKNNVEVSTDPIYTFTVTESASYTANFTAIPQYTITIGPNNVDYGTVAFGRGSREAHTYDFEDGWQGWTTFQGNTTSPHSWMHNSSYPTTNNNFSSGYGYNSSDGFMLSESYISGSSSGSGTAVTPDNYLVSPQVRLGGSISFYAGARNTSYCAEKFSVVVSTTDNTNAASFTTLATWTLSLSEAGYNSTPYTVDLSAYSGMGYVAIRHWDCNDQWFLCVDNITIVEGEEYTGISSASYYEGASCTVTATANEGYGFVNWTEDDDVVSSNASYTFTVTDNRNLVAKFLPEATQTFSFVEGWNWWAPTVEMSLADLESALGTDGILINSQHDGFVRYENGSWSGNLTEIVPGKMYRIQTSAAVGNISITGVTDAVTFSIEPGYNWFGYMGTESKAIDEALVELGVTPTEGDKINSQNEGFAIYENGQWTGRLTTLQPGHGYIYMSIPGQAKTVSPGTSNK